MTNYSYPSYFNGSKARAAGRKKSGAIARGRYKNKAVVKALETKPKKTIVKGNRSAIHTLAKQVRTLQLDKFGSLQFQFQSCQLTSSVATENPTLTTPIAFLLNGFYNNSLLYQGSVTAGVPIGTALGTKLKKQDYDTDLKNQYQWNERNNQDIVSTIQYLPVYTKIRLTFNGKLEQTETTKPIRFRVSVFKLKRQPLNTVVQSMAMPSYLGAYWHMMDDNPNSRNHFSKMYHDVIMERYVTFKPPSTPNAVESVYRTIEIPYSFPKAEPINFDKEQTDEVLWSNIPQHQCVWLMISSNQLLDSGISINIERSITWRDKHGLMP